MTELEKLKVEHDTLVQVHNEFSARTHYNFVNWLGSRIDALNETLAVAPMKPGASCGCGPETGAVCSTDPD